MTLSSLSLIRVDGADRVSFLQSQFTNDMLKLPLHQGQWQAYCTAKGRMLASLLVWQDHEAVYLQVASDLAESLIKRLRMFVLRAKVTFTLLSTWQAHMYQRPNHEQPTTTLVITQHDQRFDIMLDQEHCLSWFDTSAQQTTTHADDVSQMDRLWQTWLITAGIAHVCLATQERYVPQMVNWDLIGGVSFQKGCYPGQEVVARSHYLGKLKRRMGRATITLPPNNTATQIPPAIGNDIVTANHEPVGSIVNCVQRHEQTIDLLFEAPTEHWIDTPGNPLFWLTSNNTALTLTILPLPYDIPIKT